MAFTSGVNQDLVNLQVPMWETGKNVAYCVARRKLGLKQDGSDSVDAYLRSSHRQDLVEIHPREFVEKIEARLVKDPDPDKYEIQNHFASLNPQEQE